MDSVFYPQIAIDIQSVIRELELPFMMPSLLMHGISNMSPALPIIFNRTFDDNSNHV